MKYYSNRHFDRVQTRKAIQLQARLYSLATLALLFIVLVLVLKLQGWN